MEFEGVVTRNRAAQSVANHPPLDLNATNTLHISEDPIVVQESVLHNRGAGDLPAECTSRKNDSSSMTSPLLRTDEVNERPRSNPRSNFRGYQLQNQNRDEINHLQQRVHDVQFRYPPAPNLRSRYTDRYSGFQQSDYLPRGTYCTGSIHSPRFSDHEYPDLDGNLEDIVYDGSRTPSRSPVNTVIPIFYGDNKETWTVWYNRFDDIASRQHWSKPQKLNALLPRLQGIAGDFVYGQLPTAVRRDYDSLVSELRTRFHKIETTKRFHAKFSNRSQKPGETAEEFAAELKRLYDHAHANRDSQTRKEDLLRRFLDGLQDDQTRFHVEFIKDPETIDEAVYEVINLIDTKRSKHSQNDYRTHKSNRRTCTEESYPLGESSDEQDEHCRVVRLPAKSHHGKINENSKYPPSSHSMKGPNPEAICNSHVPWNKLEELMTSMNERLLALEQTNLQRSHMSRKSNANNQMKHTNACYNCGEEGHYSRECPKPRQTFVVTKDTIPSPAPSTVTAPVPKEN